MKPGDCINIPAEVKHWHGAAPDEWFSHLAIEVPGENSSNEWLEPVSDEEYRKLKQESLESVAGGGMALNAAALDSNKRTIFLCQRHLMIVGVKTPVQ